MDDPGTVLTFVLVVVGTSALALGARRFRRVDTLPSLEGWALADRQFGGPLTWCLLGGTIYTAYTFAAVPGLVYGAGALGFFALPYTVIVYPLAFVLLPRLWAVAKEHGYVTVADYVRGRYGSSSLALVVALTGILATMPYVALQLIGIRAVLTAGGLYPAGPAGDLVLAAVFAVLAGATWTSGLRAPALISVAKASVVFAAVAVVAVLVLVQLGGPGGVFAAAEERAARTGVPLALTPDRYVPYASLALGSAMALLMYPHVLTAAFAARSGDVLRRTTIGLPAWTAVLGLFGLLGVAALAAGIDVPPGSAETAVPLLVDRLAPAVATGLVYGALTIGALVPAAVMSVAAASLFVRNVYVEWFHPTATPKHERQVARSVSLAVKVGALAFVLGLRNSDAINLQLLGGVWILQTFPAVALGLCSSWLHRRALLAGWAVGMGCGTWLVASGGFSAVVWVGIPGSGSGVQVYAALVALAVNLGVAAVATPLLDRGGVTRGVDATTVGGADLGRRLAVRLR